MINSQSSRCFYTKLEHQVKSVIKGKIFEEPRFAGLRWHLDFPDTHQPAWLMSSGWVIQGWVLLPDSLCSPTDAVTVIARWSKLCQFNNNVATFGT